jgi:MoxR-like ATPase
MTKPVGTDTSIADAYRAMTAKFLALRNDPNRRTLGPMVLTERVGGEKGGDGPTLVDALFVAAATRRPLLITGLPGVGKTAVAGAVAEFLRSALGPMAVAEASLIFSTRTDREALLGGVDHVRRLAAAQKVDVKELGDHFVAGVFGAGFRLDTAEESEGSAAIDVTAPVEADIVVLLLDEIDKADPSLPNDLLDVLDRQSFVDDLGRTHRADTATFTVITSNAERDLPDAFMRRCIPFQMAVPDIDGLVAIGLAAFTNDERLGGRQPWSEAAIRFLAAAFTNESGPRRRRAGTAEFLDALVAADALDIGEGDVDRISGLAALLWAKPTA